jgi:hypothetical protein
MEAGLLRRLCGRDVSITVADPTELSITGYQKSAVTTPRNYLLVLFGFGSFVVGAQLFVAITVVTSLGFALTITPLVYWIPGVGYNLTPPPAISKSGRGPSILALLAERASIRFRKHWPSQRLVSLFASQVYTQLIWGLGCWPD